MAPAHTSRRRVLARLRTAAIAAAVVGLITASMSPGLAQRADAAAGDVVIQPGQLAVTFVARQCPQYTDITANRARNNIQESLRDLGQDTVYSAGEPISPAIEAPNQPNCTPLRNWDFQLGTGITGKTEQSNYLSTVTGAYSTGIRTGGPIPELDPAGVDTGRTIDGAVTVVLTADQAGRAQGGSSLWTQGGVGDLTLPPSGEYGFGALRCAIDNLNGDNVEFISYPQAARHVFCYYYAVTPPPAAGTITVVKQLAPGNIGSQDFPFRGNISYDKPSESDLGRFDLTAGAGAPGQITFIRGEVDAGEPAWNFQEQVPEGWDVVGQPSCETTRGSLWTYDATNGISVTLRAGDVVTCTFTNDRVRTGPSTLFKETVNGIGTFDFTVTPPPPADPITPRVTTTSPETPVEVAESVFRLPGEYTAVETLPEVSYGSWDLDSIICTTAAGSENVPVTIDDGPRRGGSRTIGEGESVSCVFINRFTSDGSIAIRKTTRNGVGSFLYSVVPQDPGDPSQYSYGVTTTTAGTPASATPVNGSAPADNLPIGSRWQVQEFLPAPTAGGFWRVVSADCGPGGREDAPPDATVDVVITAEAPEVTCDFTNEFVSAGSLEVIKATSADTALRPGDAVLTWNCDDSSTDHDVVVSPGVSQNTTGVIETAGFLNCTVIEKGSGAAPGVTVDTAATLSVNGVTAPYFLGDTFVIEPEDAVQVSVANRLTAAPPTPTPTPTSSPTHPPLPATGSDVDARPAAWGSVLALAAGLTLVLAARARARRRS